MIEISGIEGDHLDGRISFLRSRAAAHLELEPEAGHSRACAATLLRDSACIAFLAGRTSEACADLLSAGRQFLNVGLVEGAALVALADTVSAQEILSNYSDDIERVRYEKDRGKSSELPQDMKPMSDVGLGSPYQILSLLQADLLLVKNRMREPGPAAPPYARGTGTQRRLSGWRYRYVDRPLCWNSQLDG